MSRTARENDEMAAARRRIPGLGVISEMLGMPMDLRVVSVLVKETDPFMVFYDRLLRKEEQLALECYWRAGIVFGGATDGTVEIIMHMHNDVEMDLTAYLYKVMCVIRRAMIAREPSMCSLVSPTLIIDRAVQRAS